MVVLTMVLGTLVGILMHKLPNWAATVMGLGLMLAWATPVISAAIVYRWLFDTRYGLVNAVLGSLPDWLVGGGWQDFNWFGSPGTLFPILVVTVVWQSFPFVAISILAGLKSIPGELYEAARVDGASETRIAWSIKIPAIRPALLLTVIFSVIGTFQLFNEPKLMATLAPTVIGVDWSPNLYAYNIAFVNQDTNYAAAIAFLLGFQEQSAFTHAFREWSGMNPGAWREQVA